MKKIMVLFSAFIFAVIGMANVKAIHVVESNGNLQSGIGYNGSNVTVTENSGVYTLTLTGNAKQDLEIRSGENVILDLGSFTFENYCYGSNCGGFSSAAISILNGGTLTVKGSGTVKLQSSSAENGPSAIDNAGTLIIEGGNFSAEKKGTAAIYNSGTLTISGGTVKGNTSGSFGLTNVGIATIDNGTFENVSGSDITSVVENSGSLTINNGTFKSKNPGAAAIHNNANGTLTFNNGSVETDVSGAWGLNNEGNVTINNGTFIQNHDWSVILNSGTMTIADGTFKSSSGAGHNALISTVDSGNTTVTDGDFDAGTNGLVFYAGGGSSSTTVGKTSVVGGHFANSSDVESLLENTIYTINSNGDVVLREADYTDLYATISVAKGYDFSKYTDESVKVLLEAIEDAENVEQGLKANEQYKINNLRNAIITAIVNLVEKGDEPVKPGSTTTDTNKPAEQAPDTFDSGLTYIGLALSAIGTSVVSVKKLRNN